MIVDIWEENSSIFYPFFLKNSKMIYFLPVTHANGSYRDLVGFLFLLFYFLKQISPAPGDDIIDFLVNLFLVTFFPLKSCLCTELRHFTC